MIDAKLARRLVRQSNAIEGILRAPRKSEVEELLRFVQVEVMTIHELARFVKVYQPDAVLRTRPGLNVRIGSHTPAPGGIHILEELNLLLDEANKGTIDAWRAHLNYEHLHPFTDGNGRSGRALWVWQTIREGRERILQRPCLFLHSFYYDTLERFHLL